MTRLCPVCSQPARPEARFCPVCGSRLDARLPSGSALQNGSYVIVRSLTRGGMGAVYLARDQRAFERLCVIKQMLEYYDAADLEEKEAARERFEEEGRTLAGLAHPGIPEIYTFFQEDGRYYLVMEYIQGETLESFVTHADSQGQHVLAQSLPMEEALRYIIEVCQILEYLHSRPRPVIHGDVKPANIIVEQQLGFARLVDFGTAKVSATKARLAHTADAADAATPANGSEDNYGTSGYAAPEQYRSMPQAASDVFGLAATAYHLLTDDDPTNHPFKWPRLSQLPRELSVALQRALRTDPTRRSTVRELREALEALTMPQRQLQSFTFPGGTQIRSVSALPSLCDDHWDAAKSFLYKGDLQRWLRDINRLDLVIAGDEIITSEKNHDAGLEQFLRRVDMGLTTPRILARPEKIELGKVARESALIRHTTLHNATRGYTVARLSADVPWLEVQPATLHIWKGIPTNITAHVHAEDLPFRKEQMGNVIIETDDRDPVRVPVTATVSLWREALRLLKRLISGAVPGAWSTMRTGQKAITTAIARVRKPFDNRPWLVAILWIVLSGLLLYGAYMLPAQADQVLSLFGITLAAEPLIAHLERILVAGASPPAAWIGLVVAAYSITSVIGLLIGLIRGAWKAIAR